jgi:hypothetical protein
MYKTQRKQTGVLMTNKKTVSVIFFRRLSCVNPTDIAEEATQTQTHRCNQKAPTLCVLIFCQIFVPLHWGAARGFRKSLYTARYFPYPSSLDQGRNKLKSAIIEHVISCFLDVLSWSFAAFCKIFHSSKINEG